MVVVVVVIFCSFCLHFYQRETHVNVHSNLNTLRILLLATFWMLSNLCSSGKTGMNRDIQAAHDIRLMSDPIRKLPFLFWDVWHYLSDRKHPHSLVLNDKSLDNISSHRWPKRKLYTNTHILCHIHRYLICIHKICGMSCFHYEFHTQQHNSIMQVLDIFVMDS